LARACAIGARWSGGALERHHGADLNAYETHLDVELPPKKLLFEVPAYKLPPQDGQNTSLSKTITADLEWVEIDCTSA
jgi:hypothetical protein